MNNDNKKKTRANCISERRIRPRLRITVQTGPDQLPRTPLPKRPVLAAPRAVSSCPFSITES